MSRFGAYLICIWILSAASPIAAAERTALLIEAADQSQSSIARGPASTLAAHLHEVLGFEVVRSTPRTGRDLARDADLFRQRTERSEIALIYFSGAVEHDNNGTYLLPGSGSDGIQIDDLIIFVERNSRYVVMILDDASTTPVTPGRNRGFGRLPSLPDRMLILLSNRTKAKVLSSTPGLGAAIAVDLDRADFRPSSLISKARDRIYLASYGLEVPKTLGSMPDTLTFPVTPERSSILGEIRTIAKALCSEDYSKSQNATESKIVSYYSKQSVGIRVAALGELDSLSLMALLKLLPRSGPCPYLPPAAPATPAPNDKPSTAALPPSEMPPPKKTEPGPADRPSEPKAAAIPPKDESNAPRPQPPRRITPESEPETKRQRPAQRDTPPPAKRETPPKNTAPPSSRAPVNIPM